MTDVVRVEGLIKRYGDFTAVDGLDFALGEGRVLGLVGPNGAGKTTAMRAIAGIVQPSEGRSAVCGFDVTTHPVEAKQRMAWVPHAPKLFDALTVTEHLEFVASTWGVAQYRERGDDLLRRFDLHDRRDAVAQSLSTGMRQKLALVCAALHQPSLMMLDEPMTGLDPRAIRTMKEWVKEEAARGATILISSHLLTIVEDLCTDLLILVRGQARFFGPVEQARSQFDQADLEELFFQATA
jgi:ABC-2 type transport system ATP-binding protein